MENVNLKNEPPADAKPVLPAVAELKIRNFKAKLPDDYVSMVEVITLPKEKITPIVSGNINNLVLDGYKAIKSHDTFMCIPSASEFHFKNTMAKNIACRNFCIREDEILFSGGYSNFFLFRWFQKLAELIKPKKVIVKYVNTEQCRSHCR